MTTVPGSSSQIEPQSNQRGIETVAFIEEHGEPAEGLNRTSVGLKLQADPPLVVPEEKPQSNQRGIETKEILRLNDRVF
jgi:hypothetical protein